MMRLRILGTRGNIEVSAPEHVNHSGILIDDRLLLDIGEKEYLKYRPQWIFITHLHSDHAAVEAHDIPDDVTIFGPEASRRLPGLQIVSTSVAAGSYKVTPVPTVHSRRVRSAGYVVQKGKTRIFYSSDMIRIESKYHRLLRNLDLVITEGSFLRSGGLIRLDADTGEPMGHNGIPDLVGFFKPFTSCIVITHFGTWYFKNIVESRKRIEAMGNGVRVIPAYDGMLVDTCYCHP